MGCIACKTATVVPIIVDQVEGHLLRNVEEFKQQNTVVHKTTASSLQSDMCRKSSSDLKKRPEQAPSPKESSENYSSEVTTFQTMLTTPCFIRTIESNAYENVRSVTNSSTLKTKNSPNEMDARLTPSNSEEVEMRPNPIRTIVIASIQSDVLEEHIPYGTLSNEVDQLHSTHSYIEIIGSSLSTNIEKTISSSIRLKGAEVKNNFHTDEKTSLNDLDSDLDESYPIHNSILSSTASFSEDSSSQQEIMDDQTLPEMQNITFHPTIHDLEKTNPHYQTLSSQLSNDSEDTMIYRRTVIRSKSPILAMSDICQKPIVYETSSLSDDSQIDL